MQKWVNFNRRNKTMQNYKLKLKDIDPKLAKKVKQLKKNRIDFDKEQDNLLKEGKIVNKARYYPF